MPVTSMSMEEVIDTIDLFLDSRKISFSSRSLNSPGSFDLSSPPGSCESYGLSRSTNLSRSSGLPGSQIIVTLNSEMAGLALRNREFKDIIINASLVVPDGIGIILAAKFFGHSLRERVCGIELAENLLELARKKGYGVYLLGSRDYVLEKALENLERKYDGLKIVGSHHGYFQESEEKLVLNEIQNKRPHIILVGMGTPLQEKWISKHRKQLGQGVCVGVGGSFQVWAGFIPRAPLVMRRIGLEWMYRFLREPKRLIRLVLPIQYGFRVIIVAIKQRFAR